MDLTEIRERLRRTPWNQFPPVVILADVPVAKNHPSFAAAKAGDAKAADSVVEDTLAITDIERVRALIREGQPHLLPVHAVEEVGMNAIPRAFARALAIRLNVPLGSGVIQMNRVSHTGAGGYHRLAFPPVFEGDVEALEYILVDDFVGQGGTLANLRGYIERGLAQPSVRVHNHESGCPSLRGFRRLGIPAADTQETLSPRISSN